MKIISNREYAIASTDVRGINNKEMRQMHELKNRINDVLDSHKPDSKEKKYISDDDLKLTHAILSVFTKEYESTVIADIFIYPSVCYLPVKSRCVDNPKGEEKIVQKVNTQPFILEINS